MKIPDNISPLLLNLSERQREVLKQILLKLQTGKKILPKDIDQLADDDCATGIRVQKVFDISQIGLLRWVDHGCPRNPNKTYSLADIYKWRVSKIEERTDKPTGLKDEKTKQEIDLLKARIEKERQTNIPRSLHETIMTSRAGSLRTFLEKTAMANAVHLAGKTVDEVRAQLYRLLQAAMEAYAGKGDNE
jgi:hypothetical protein